jgi:Kef-type K+ transport system membrane component KefB
MYKATEESEQRLLPAPGRGIAVAAGLTAAAAALLAVAFGTGWLAPVHAAAHPAVHAAATQSAPSPMQLLWRLFLAVAVIAVLARLCGVLALRIGQPAVLGEILAGLLLGPTVLSTLAPALTKALLPPAVLPDVSLLAQAGLVIFMFSVGLEVDRNMLRLHGKVIGVASQAMMVVPFALGVVVAVPLYATFAGRTAGAAPYAIFVGTALSVTAFPVLARIVRESGLADTRLGSMAMLCAAVCDVLAWCALAVVLAMTRAQGPWAVIRELGVTAALCAVLFAAQPLLVALTDRYRDAEVPGSVRLVLVVGLIFGLAAITDKIGIHDIFGGFLAGLVLPRDTRLFRPVTMQLGTLNQALLLPVFFVSIGLQVNVWQAAARPEVLAGGVVLLLVAIGGKLGGTAVLASAGGMPLRSALGLAALMNTRGVTDIVVISAGLSAGVINGDAFTVLVLMALITTAMAEPALRWLGLWQQPMAALAGMGMDSGAPAGPDAESNLPFTGLGGNTPAF